MSIREWHIMREKLAVGQDVTVNEVAQDYFNQSAAAAGSQR